MKEARQIQRSQSSPSLFTPDQLELASSFAYLEFQSEEEKHNLSWLVPSTPVETLPIFTTPLSCQKIKTETLGKTALLQFKPHNPFSSAKIKQSWSTFFFIKPK